MKTDVSEWAGGERYGFENVDYYAEYRGVVTGASPGDSVEVWFTGTATGKDLPKGQKPGRSRASTSPTRSRKTPGTPC